MALRGTLTHWKTRMLASELGMMPCQALGVLEALWHTTAELAPSGNIGRLPNQAIAMEMFYEGDAEQLIAALLKTRHLEEHPTYRLIVHDWTQHVDHNTKRKVERRGQSMIANDGSSQVMTRHKSIPVPDPVPVPEPDKKKQKTSRDKREADSRHVPFRLACETYATYKHVEFVWDAGEAKQLAMLLAASPSLTLGTFQRCLNHRAKSEVAHGERPREWLGTILKYQEGPLDKYGKPQGVGNGTFKSKSESSFDALKRSLEAGRNQAAAVETFSPAAGEDCGTGVCGILGRPDGVRPEGHSSSHRILSGS